MNKTYTSSKLVRGRNNALSIPYTGSTPTDGSLLYNLQIPGNSSFAPYLEEYAILGYFALSDMINSYIATKTCIDSSKCNNNQNVQINTPGVVNFPSPKVQTLGFWGLVGSLFGLFIILGLLFPISNMTRTLVLEKETKIREGMMMMSLRSDVLWISWWLNFVFLFLPLSILLTIIGRIVFTYSSPIYIFFYFFLFFLASISYAIFISTIFNTARTASIISALVYFGGYFIYVGLNGTGPSRGALLLASLHPSAAFALGALAFIEYEDTSIGVTAATVAKSATYQITFADILGMLCIDTLYLLALAWYLANVSKTYHIICICIIITVYIYS